jgi:hypothetical protein
MLEKPLVCQGLSSQQKRKEASQSGDSDLFLTSLLEMYEMLGFWGLDKSKAFVSPITKKAILEMFMKGC